MKNLCLMVSFLFQSLGEGSLMFNIVNNGEEETHDEC